MYHAQLRAFHAVATHGGFTKAANHLGVSQPAVSDQVRKLEERFSVLLFNRHKRSVFPTELGERLLDITRRQFELEKQAIELLTETQSLNVGHLKVTADSPLHIIQIIGMFHQQYEGISISLKTGNSDDVLEQLFSYKADIGVLGHSPEDDRLVVLPLRDDPLVAFVSWDHPWATRSEVSIHDLKGQPLILREEGSRTRRIVENEFTRLGFEPNVIMDVTGQEATREAVAANIGVGIVSRPEFGHDTRLKRLRKSVV